MSKEASKVLAGTLFDRLFKKVCCVSYVIRVFYMVGERSQENV